MEKEKEQEKDISDEDKIREEGIKKEDWLDKEKIIRIQKYILVAFRREKPRKISMMNLKGLVKL